MSHRGLEQLLSRWINDAAFRVEMERDLESAVRRSGITLTPAEWAFVRRVNDWVLTDVVAPTNTKRRAA